jgi:hypothetical protein
VTVAKTCIDHHPFRKAAEGACHCFNAWYTAAMKSGRKLEAPRDETRKKMRPVTKADFNKLVQKAIQTPSTKSSSKKRRPAGESEAD